MKTFLIFLLISVVRGYDNNFDPIQFVAAAKQDPQEFDFTLPSDIETYNPYKLAQDVIYTQGQVDSLMNNIEDYVKHFDNATGPELLQIQSFAVALQKAQNDLKVVNDRLFRAQGRYDNITITIGEFASQLRCYQNSGCNVPPSTTTLPPAPVYNCSSASSNQVVTAANQTGQFKISSRQQFNNCTLTLTSQLSHGLYFNLNITNFAAYGSGSSLIIIPYGSGDNYNITGDQQINGISAQIVDIVAIGELKFVIDYIALGVCGNYDCGGGNCTSEQGNKPTCICNNCYTQDDQGKCTIHRPDACLGVTKCSMYENGTCVSTPWNCDYYCQCPGLPANCTTKKYCYPGDTTCPDDFRLTGFWNRFHV